MITLNIKLKQFLEIEDLNIDDDDALEDKTTQNCF